MKPDFFDSMYDNPIYDADFYKFGHVYQYIKGLKRIWVNFTPRSTRVEGETGVRFFGLQHFVLKQLIERFHQHFFSKSWEEFAAGYKLFVQATLGVTNPDIEHLRLLHLEGHLPIKIYALPEGTYVPLGCPAAVIVNTVDHAFWLPNYIETMMSNWLWGPCTSATTAARYRRIFEKWAYYSRITADNIGFIDWQGHDFSYRGMFGRDAAILSGMGHLLSFSGTDTVPAILEAVKYYDAPLSVGGSVYATEHSVMCAGSKEKEEETFRRLIVDVHPQGIVSIVSDTWDLWNVLKNIASNLRAEIREHQGKIVFRPDSGDPVKILTGDPEAAYGTPAHTGALGILADSLGYTYEPNLGGKMLRNAGLIYGDSITPERADQILQKTTAQGFSPFNHVFGIGSYTYQYVTRDTFNFAFKATAIEKEIDHAGLSRHGQDSVEPVRMVEAIFKDPVTDTSNKKSHRGIPVPLSSVSEPSGISVLQTVDPRMLDHSLFREVFREGQLLIRENFQTIRERTRS